MSDSEKKDDVSLKILGGVATVFTAAALLGYVKTAIVVAGATSLVTVFAGVVNHFEEKQKPNPAPEM